MYSTAKKLHEVYSLKQDMICMAESHTHVMPLSLMAKSFLTTAYPSCQRQRVTRTRTRASDSIVTMAVIKGVNVLNIIGNSMEGSDVRAIMYEGRGRDSNTE